ncbi:flagellar hook-associated protein FlgK [Methylovorus mays]|uniref:flagellar hook-associated protein FlgK n=1 Tax=Methylovorus mays TaxID=184077 RepID=UPI001E559E0C|nr:flagellar hook-associated protein FlgK [Methylovorus mays]MCB5207489.1 flagellar hook-associated protein FlgK [Methylovorus mays]
MGSDILNIGKSALSAAQVAIAVTGNNIANASTAGYNRQYITQAAAGSQDMGFGYVGKGTDVTSVQRVFSALLAKQVNTSQASSSALTAYSTQIETINNMLADSSAGLSPAMQEFFDSVQDLATTPGDSATRQALISNSEALASRFQSMSSQLDEVEASVNSQVSSSVSLINSYAKQIAALNDSIEQATNSTGNAPNDLLDQRDLLVSELSKQIKTTVVQQGNSYNVFVGNGLPMVVDKQSYSLGTTANPTNNERLEVTYIGSSGNGTILGENSLSGGTLGGLVEFRNETLDPARNQLGLIAVSLTQTFNAQHAAGTDLDGNAGGNFFTPITPTITANANNTGNADFSASYSDVSAMTSSDYSISYDGTNYTIKRLSDNTSTSVTGFPTTVDGVTINLDSGTMASGDSFLLQPTAKAAGQVEVAISDVDAIAAGTSSESGDNTNALLLAALQTNKTVGGSKSYEEAFAQLVSQVGNKTNEIRVTSAAETALLEDAQAQMESNSGVNLDEEAANLLRYQQAYQSAAKVMQIASEMFDTLLSISQ